MEFPFSLEDENKKSSEHSPGPVASQELIVRECFNPEHFLEGKYALSNAAITQRDLTSNGLSIHRLGYLSDAQLKEIMLSRKNDRPDLRTDAHISTVQTATVREIKDDTDYRAFVVIDTALEQNIAHASCYSAVNRQPAQIRAIRMKLIDLLNKNLAPINLE